MITLSLWHILAAAVANFVIGYAWYHTGVFGTVWMRLSGITPEQAERTKRRMGVSIAVALIASLLMAYVLTYLAAAWGVVDIAQAVQLGFWVWIGFVAPTFLHTVLWEGRPLKLYFINVLYWLLALIVMSVILVL